MRNTTKCNIETKGKPTIFIQYLTLAESFRFFGIKSNDIHKFLYFTLENYQIKGNFAHDFFSHCTNAHSINMSYHSKT